MRKDKEKKWDVPLFIAVIGGHDCSVKVAKVAEEVGKGIAQLGATLVCGGLTGVMEAACKGATSAGGKTIGILPGHDKREANHYVDIPIATGLGYMRNNLVVKNADCVIAIDGKEGTLSEIAFALQMNKPIAGIDTWDIPGVIKLKNAREAIEWIKNRDTSYFKKSKAK
ncbi:MAG: TIGR00725 family protein [Candidatus Omnitrophica bacterium]|nr:TIGR00725 family protein [Candidatus Omnitrophota bacterium]